MVFAIAGRLTRLKPILNDNCLRVGCSPVVLRHYELKPPV